MPKNTKRTILSIAQPIIVSLTIVAGVYVFGGVPLQKVIDGFTTSSFHSPDWQKLSDAALAVRIHLGVAILALAIGGLQFVLPKGTRLHRGIGWGWLMLMLTAAVSSFFLRNIRPGHFSLVHGLSVLTLIAVPWIIYTAKTGRIAEHRRTVVGLYVGGLVVAGVLAFLPGRVLWSVVFG